MAEKTVNVSRFYGETVVVPVRPDTNEIPCGTCWGWSVYPYGNLIRCYESNSTRYNVVQPTNGGDCGDYDNVTVYSFGKSPTGFVRIFIRRSTYSAIQTENCDWTTAITETRTSEIVEFSTNTEIGCALDEGGSITVTIPIPNLEAPSIQPCPTGQGLFNEFRTNSHFVEINDDIIGWTFLQNGSLEDSGFPLPPP